MFGLIPLVATIILGGLIAAAIAYLGGDIFSESTVKAEAQKAINEGEQIFSAIRMYQIDNNKLPDDGSGGLDLNLILSDKRYYSGPYNNWNYNGNGVAKNMAKEQSCLVVNEDQGYSSTTVPSCSSIPAALTDAKYYCCTP